MHNYVFYYLGPVYMMPLSRDEMRGGIILVYWNKSRLMIQQNITVFLWVDYTTWKPKDVKAATVILFNYEIF